MKCVHCGKPIYQYSYQWRHTDGMFTCVSVPGKRAEAEENPVDPLKHLDLNGRDACRWASTIGGMLTLNANEVNCQHCLDHIWNR